jgi:hypothetical protein
MANSIEEEIHWLKSVVPYNLETRGFALLVRVDAYEELFLSIRIVPY